MRIRPFVPCFIAILLGACVTTKDNAPDIASLDRYVSVKSTAPAQMGQEARIYVREVALNGAGARNAAANGVVLFVHGAGTPAEVAFDVPYKDYSWMAYLARAGFDVFSMDMTGYGRSTRPAAMKDPCNLSKSQQAALVPAMMAAPCAPSYATAMTTMSSDWDDIGAVVDYLRSLRGVDKVSIVAWSQGGPRAVGYAAHNTAKVSRIVVLAPGYGRNSPAGPPSSLPTLDGSMNSQSAAEFAANLDRQVGCPGQYEAGVREAVWAQMLASDPEGAAWKPAIRRAPNVPTWGFNQATVANVQVPLLMVTGEYDKQVVPARVRELYADYGGRQKVLVELACSSHSAMWEGNHLLLFKASRDWLVEGRVDGKTLGEVRLGY